MLQEYLQYIQESLPDGVEIREISLDEWPSVMSPLFQEFNRDTKDTVNFSAAPDQSWKDRLNQIRGKAKVITLVASKQGKDIGFVVGIIDLARPNMGIIKYVYLHKDYRGSGIMDTMVHQIIKWFKSNKAPIVRIWTAGGNKRALAFYKKMGFDVELYGLRNIDSKNIPIKKGQW